MPFAATTMTEDEDLKAREKNQGVNVSGTSTSFATGIPGQETSGQQKQAGSGSKFANIQGYLEANKPQGEAMGQKVASGIETGGQEAQQKIGSFQAQAPTVAAYDPNEAYKNITGLSEADKASYNTAKAGYKGPQQLEQVQGYGEAQKAASTAGEKAKQAGTSEGQMQLLKSTYERPNYTGGETALDQIIMQNAPGAKSSLQDMSKKYSGLEGLFGNAAQNVGGRVSEAMKTSLANQQGINTGEGRAQEDLMNPIRQRTIDKNAENIARINATKAELESGYLSNASLRDLGLSEGQNLYDLNLASYFNPDQTQVGINEVATPEERQRYAALTNLISGAPGQEITAGGKTINPIGLNQDAFSRDIAGKKTEAEGAKSAYSIDVSPAALGGGWQYDNPFNTTALKYDQYSKIQKQVDDFFSNPQNMNSLPARRALEQAAIDAGIANANVTKDTPENVFLAGISSAKQKYDELGKNYNLSRVIQRQKGK